MGDEEPLLSLASASSVSAPPNPAAASGSPSRRKSRAPERWRHRNRDESSVLVFERFSNGNVLVSAQLDDEPAESQELAKSRDEPLVEAKELPESREQPLVESKELAEFRDEPSAEATELAKSRDQSSAESHVLPESRDHQPAEAKELPESRDQPTDVAKDRQRAERLELEAKVLAKSREQRRRVEELQRRIALLHGQQLLYHGEDQLHQLMSRLNPEFLRVLSPMTLADVNNLMSDPLLDEKLAKLMQSGDTSLRLNCLSRSSLSSSSASLIAALQRYDVASGGRPFPLDLMPKEGPRFVGRATPQSAGQSQHAGPSVGQSENTGQSQNSGQSQNTGQSHIADQSQIAVQSKNAGQSQKEQVPSLQRLFQLTKTEAAKVCQSVNPMIAVCRYYLENVLDPDDATDYSDSDDEDAYENECLENKKAVSVDQNVPAALKTDSLEVCTAVENELIANVRLNSNPWTLLRRRAKLGSRWEWLQAEMSALEMKEKHAAHFLNQLRARRAAIPFVPGPSVPDEFLPAGETEPTLDAELCLPVGVEKETCARVRGLRGRWPKRKLVRLPRSSTVCREISPFVWRPFSDYCECSPKTQLCVVCTASMEISKQVNTKSSFDHQHSAVPGEQPTAKTSSLPNERSPAVLSRKRQFCFLFDDDTDSDSESFAQNFSSQFPKKRSRTTNQADHSSNRVLPPDEETTNKLLAAKLHRTTNRSGDKNHRRHKPVAGLESHQRGSRLASPAAPSFGGGSQSMVASKAKALEVSGRRRKTLSAEYDIDNIVVDPSVGAVTRVSLLPFKTIKTPSWSKVDETEDEPSLSTAGSLEEPLEDLSDEAFLRRHQRGELEERKRFEAYAQLVRSSSGSSRRSSNAASAFHHRSVASTATNQRNSTSAPAQANNCNLISGSNIDRLSIDSSNSKAAADAFSARANAAVFCSSGEDDGRSVPDGHVTTSSFPPRQFPLSEAEYAALLEEQRIAEAEQKAVEENFKKRF